MSDTFLAPDGKPRCRWCSAAPDFLPYHDTEWGFPVADDVRLSDIGESLSRFSLEGPRAGEILERALAGAPLPQLAADTWGPATLAGAEIALGAWSTSGEEGFQVFAAAEAEEAVADALRAAGGERLRAKLVELARAASRGEILDDSFTRSSECWKECENVRDLESGFWGDDERWEDPWCFHCVWRSPGVINALAEIKGVEWTKRRLALWDDTSREYTGRARRAWEAMNREYADLDPPEVET